MTDHDFKRRIQDHFEGNLTGALVVSGTRTAYILEQSQSQSFKEEDPGAIDRFREYADFLIPKYQRVIKMFFDLGGQNLIIPIYPYQVFYARGEEYAKLAMETTTLLIEESFVNFYKKMGIDPYFAGLDSLKQFPIDHMAHQVYQRLKMFCDQWDYKHDHLKVIWEVAPVPLFSYWNNSQSDSNQQLTEAITSTNDLRDIYNLLYKHYSKAVYGVELPMPHFYIGSNRNGELKLRSMYPISMLAGDPFRLFYLPYPTLYLSEIVFKAILEDLAFGEPLRALKKDYSGQLTSEMIRAERQRIIEISNDPSAVVGMTRYLPQND